MATPRILTAARTISQRRRLSGLRGSLLNGLLRHLRGNSRRNCRLRCGRTGRCGLSSRLSCGLDLLTGLRHLSVNGHLTAQELTHAGGQLGHKTLDRAQSRNVGAHVQGCAVHAGGANLHQLLRRTRNAHSVKNGAPITLNRSQRIVRVKLQRRGGGTRRSCCWRSRGIRRRRSMRCRRGVTRQGSTGRSYRCLSCRGLRGLCQGGGAKGCASQRGSTRAGMLRTALLRAALLRGRLRGSRLLNRGARSLRIRCLSLRSQASRRHTRRTSSRHATLRRTRTSRNRTSSTRSHATLQNLQARSQRRNLSATGRTLHRRQKQTSTQQLQLKLRIRRTRHTIQSLIRRTRSNRQLTLTQSLSLLSQTLQLILRNTLQNLAGSLRNSLHHNQITQTLQQILHKTARILTGRHHTRHRTKESRRILRTQRLNDLIQKLRVGITQQRHRTVILNTVLRRRTSHQLIKNRQRITHRTAASTNHQLQHARLNGHLLLIAQTLQERQKNLRRNQTERVMVSTRTNRTQHLIRLSCREDKLHVLRRFLHNLQQRIETLTGHHMRLINNEDLVTVTHRR